MIDIDLGRKLYPSRPMLNDSSPWRVGCSCSYEAASAMDESSEASLSGSRAGQITHKKS